MKVIYNKDLGINSKDVMKSIDLNQLYDWKMELTSEISHKENILLKRENDTKTEIYLNSSRSLMKIIDTRIDMLKNI